MRTSLYNYLLFVIFGATVTINHCCMAESASAVHKNIYVRLAGAGEVNRFVMTDCHASPISTGRSKQKNQVDQQMAALVTDLELKKDIRKKAVTQISANLGSKMFSADFSPNGKYAIVAFDDPMISAVKRAAIIQIPDGQIVMNIRDDSQIEDMLWCTNSDVLLILASQQHVQLRIRGNYDGTGWTSSSEEKFQHR